MNPSLRCLSVGGTLPSVHKAHWAAPNSTILGNVTLDEGSAIFSGVILRGIIYIYIYIYTGDNCKISIGKRAIIQDNTIIKDTRSLHGAPPIEVPEIIISDKVIIGCNCTINSGCKIDANCVIGDGCNMGEDCIVESYSMIAAGCSLDPNTHVPAGQIWAGSPGRYLRDLTPQEKMEIANTQQELEQLAFIYAEGKIHFIYIYIYIRIAYLSWEN